MRFFDVEWDEIEHAPHPVAPLRFVSPPAAGIDVVHEYFRTLRE
jgi:hypothetical protein